jgi:hypothetical protein
MCKSRDSVTDLDFLRSGMFGSLRIASAHKFIFTNREIGVK